MSTYATAAPPETPDIGTYTYIARNGQILFALAGNDFGSYDNVGRAPYYVDKKLADWERDADIAFDEYVGRILGGGAWEYNGSSAWDGSDPLSA